MTETYLPAAPRALPALRALTAAWLAAEGTRFYALMALAGRQWLPPGRPLAAGAARVARAEHARVSGELYWVSAAMTELACHAAPALPARSLHSHDLPSPSGLMAFEAPLARYVNDDGRDVEIVAASWGPWDGPAGQWKHGGIWLTFWSHPAAALPRDAFTGGTADLAALGPAAASLPPFLPDNEVGWPFGDLPADQEIPDGTTAAWALAVRAAWRLMRQPLAACTAEQAPRAARRRLARAGQWDTGVRVVRIRRPQQPPAPGATLPQAASTASSGGSPGTGGPTGAGQAAPAARTGGSAPTSPAPTASPSAAPSASTSGTGNRHDLRPPAHFTSRACSPRKGPQKVTRVTPSSMSR